MVSMALNVARDIPNSSNLVKLMFDNVAMKVSGSSQNSIDLKLSP